ncbi:FixH family protein [Erythrobacter colymbi]|uniref:FixH family protein n=1 Tax=Erythrobacter colymbi TaxID=1161202 RepID=UPI000A3A3D1E|nr:FixH family protein [Erythrobacter colymbi]
MPSHTKAFTGKHMAAIFVAGFGIVIAVNLGMATMAVESFHGTVVDNSYVASQNYNGWLKQAAASKALGWQAVPHLRADGHVVIEALGVPAGARMTATAEHPLGLRDDAAFTFTDEGRGRWVSNETVAPGRWQLRIAIRAGDQAWAGEGEIR